MSADARVWCEGGSLSWKGWADGTDVRPVGELVDVIAELEAATNETYYWLPTEHGDGPALSGWVWPR